MILRDDEKLIQQDFVVKIIVHTYVQVVKLWERK